MGTTKSSKVLVVAEGREHPIQVEKTVENRSAVWYSKPGFDEEDLVELYRRNQFPSNTKIDKFVDKSRSKIAKSRFSRETKINRIIDISRSKLERTQAESTDTGIIYLTNGKVIEDIDYHKIPQYRGVTFARIHGNQFDLSWEDCGEHNLVGLISSSRLPVEFLNDFYVKTTEADPLPEEIMGNLAEF